MTGLGGHTNIDHSVFSQIVRGTYTPFFGRDISMTNPLSLVKSANLQTIAKASNRVLLDQLLESVDLTSYGYFTDADYSLKITVIPGTGTYTATLQPVKIYELRENINLPPPPDKRASNILVFLSDEFERVKIRAESVLSTSPSNHLIAVYARRNLQLGHKLFHDSRILFHTTCINAEPKPADYDVYAVYILNLFIIQSLVFYSKLFSPYVATPALKEEDLRATLMTVAPAVVKYPWLYDQRPNLELVFSSLVRGAEKSKVDSHLMDMPVDKSMIAETKEKFKGKFQFTGNANIGIDFFYQFLQHKNEKGEPYFKCRPTELAELLSQVVIDKNGDPLNYNTIMAIFKNSNFKKRPHPTDPKKINILPKSGEKNETNE